MFFLLKSNIAKVFFILVVFVHVGAGQDVQKGSQYLLGTEEQLEMVVHVWGEVRSPGQFKVPYNTTILDIISKAGGPTQYANLSKVRLTRETEGMNLTQQALKNLMDDAKAGKIEQGVIDETIKSQYSQRILTYNLKDYLQNKKVFNPPIQLRPGDVVFLPQNSWYRWRELVQVTQQIAVIASVYVWYLRAESRL
jgi:protein involved in polysaccharide export with SLBB domain